MLRHGRFTLPHVGVVQWTGRPPQLKRHEDAFIGLSIRNRHFSRKFLKDVLALVLEEFRELYVIIFDIPYAYNDAAERGEDQPSSQDIDKNVRIGDEREESIRKIAASLGTLDSIKIERWAQVQSHEVETYRLELRSAVETNGPLRNSLLINARRWLKKRGRVEAEEFIEFQIQELPVLIDVYYNKGFLVDIYPGYYFLFFFELERGEWNDELPQCSKAANGKHLCFITVPTEQGIQVI